MRQNASDLVRRAESGEHVTITVSGRPAAVLGPVAPRAWREWGDLDDLFHEPVDDAWSTDRDLLEDVPIDPWTRQ